MDFLECEAPLDSSFQKDRLELVNKGSLGRRRKPSRSNLRLILSPANDQQDIDVFHSHQNLDSESSFIQKRATPSNSFEESILDNQQETVIGSHRCKNSTNCQKKDTSPKYSHQNGVFSNYREVVESINQIYSTKCFDFNGNSQQPVVSSRNRQNFTVGNHGDIVQNSHQKIKSENNNVNSKHHLQTSVIKNKLNVDVKGYKSFTKLNNSDHVTTSDIHHSTLIAENQNTAKSQSCQKITNIRNQQHNQKTVASNNHQNIITFSNRRQIVTSTPIQTKKSTVPNGNHEGRTLSQDHSSKLYIESSLPQTSKEPNLVAEAQQFSIEAKLRRKKSEVQGRSAVLIQTWERRTVSESFSKQKRDSKTALKNRFSGKEVSDANSIAMPDSYICIKYKGSLQNGDNLLKGDLVPNVRDVRPDETMLFRIPDNRRQATELAETTNDKVSVNRKPSVQEPEWISLSRKLCAKFVEGHIESHSPDSFPHEEPEGVGEEPIPSLQPIKTHSSNNTAIQTEVQKRKVIPTPPSDETSASNGPPWIHLSRKLCTKFIEEHIEYPPVTNGHFIEDPELVEPNGDVRIIEKIGKPKGNKSKQKKECEPEWIKLSKKLRAKFIESHIDDPDTIALDNQLNASDHEETGSESLSDISQETTISKEIAEPLKAMECKNFMTKSEKAEVNSKFHETDNNQKSNDSVVFAVKECCWEYQEMEFDQESNSGNFQELEFFDQPLQEENYINNQESFFQDSLNKFEERITFENSCSQQNPECYNNDVKFAPRCSKDESVSDCPQQNKLITVQFIAHTRNDPNCKHEEMNDISHSTRDTKYDSFFNLSTWEEARFKDEECQKISEKASLCKDFRSKSLDDLYDSSEEKVLVQNENFDKSENRNSPSSANVIDPEEKYFTQSEEFRNKERNEIHLHEFKLDPECSSNISSSKESPNRVAEDGMGESESKTASWCGCYQEKKQNIYDAINVESSSEDEVFECDSKTRNICSNSSEATHCGKISTRRNSSMEKENYVDQKQVSDERVKYDPSNENDSHVKCNGKIPNSIYGGDPGNKKPSDKNNKNESCVQEGRKEPIKLGMSKWITISKPEMNVSKPEYSNIQSSIHKEQNNQIKPLEIEAGSKIKLKKNNKENGNVSEKRTVSNVPDKNARLKYENEYPTHCNTADENSYKFNESFKELDLKSKCKSLCDISYINNSLHDEGSFRQHESVADLCSAAQTPNHRKIEFQHFEFNSEIPLCAKLVSNHDKRNISKSITTLQTNKRIESPCLSESSHVYEDMFKETPSGPSDSEASSWTAMKNNTYYVNGRSSSMNDLDFSDSCSLSVKCDYASSSEDSTLQSRHSSYASSNFYVNLRDYDSHMLEPSLIKGNKSNGRIANNDITSNISKSNPPTPESLRHLFTSPLSSVHSPANRTPRLLNRMPSDPQSHYYSTASATSSAFKHGFALTPPKPKKAERSSSIKIKDIAHGIILTFKKFQNNSKNSSVSSTQQVDVSHLAEMKSNSELGKTKKGQKDSKKQNRDKSFWTENGKTDTDSGFLSDVQRAKAHRSSSDLTDMKSNSDLFHSDKKKGKSSKKGSNRDKGKKSKMKVSEPRTVPTVSRKVQQMADGTLYLVTTVSGDTTLPGVYSDSPDTSSELSSHRPVKFPEESNC